MPFGRRDKKKLTTYIKSIFLFFISFSRARKYISLSFKRLKGTPHELALGFSTGVAISFTPFIGFHALISIFLLKITSAYCGLEGKKEYCFGLGSEIQ